MIINRYLVVGTYSLAARGGGRIYLRGQLPNPPLLEGQRPTAAPAAVTYPLSIVRYVASLTTPVAVA